MIQIVYGMYHKGLKPPTCKSNLEQVEWVEQQCGDHTPRYPCQQMLVLEEKKTIFAINFDKVNYEV
jgi:hypothetical protein